MAQPGVACYPSLPNFKESSTPFTRPLPHPSNPACELHESPSSAQSVSYLEDMLGDG